MKFLHSWHFIPARRGDRPSADKYTVSLRPGFGFTAGKPYKGGGDPDGEGQEAEQACAWPDHWGPWQANCACRVVFWGKRMMLLYPCLFWSLATQGKWLLSHGRVCREGHCCKLLAVAFAASGLWTHQLVKHQCLLHIFTREERHSDKCKERVNEHSVMWKWLLVTLDWMALKQDW